MTAVWAWPIAALVIGYFAGRLSAPRPDIDARVQKAAADVAKPIIEHLKLFNKKEPRQ